MSDSDSVQADSGSTDEPARKADVMPTASGQLAQLIADAEADLDALASPGRKYWQGWHACTTMFLRRLKEIDGVQQRKLGEEGIPTS